MKIKENHPSFGLISISRVQSTGTILFGSRIKHDSFIQLEIHKAEEIKDEYSEHIFSRNCLISINLSASQFANMLVQSNTSGVPCTIVYTENEGYIEKQKELKELKKEMEEDTENVLNRLKETTLKLSDIVTKEFKGQINKNTKDRIRDLTIQISNGINSNLDFLLKQQTKKLEQIGSEIVSEAEARINSIIYEKGIEKIKNLKEIE